ncbi:hypothetical protein [Okeania sp. KiyG1]|uniref:hypothetical protein n=1 Tax=Okeania sp. KiyG1 TaxID=2720165 RepID=UPI001923FA8C|nr:hypothetical protein [Okeania sp. KiyG1]GGA21317.1 hypothetical protein CYANOKiyG1_36260 [Okeania sp. KiyG1]
MKKSNSDLDAENARFELSIPLNLQQLEQCQDSDVSLTPFFQKGEGTVILKQLVLSLPKPQIQQEIEPEQISKTIPLLPTTGYVEQVEISQENQLSIKGWVAGVNSGFLENMKVILGGVEIQNFQLKKGIPSPDVKKSNSDLDAENARFELSIPLNSQQLEQCQDSDVSLTPFFQKGEGTVILKQLVLSLPKPQIQQEIEPEQISKTIPLLPTTGYVEQVEISQENQLSIKGWVAGVNSGFLENMKVILGGVEIQNFQLKKGIPSPDVKKSNSDLDAENARFELSIPLNSQQLEQCQDSDVSLTPFFQKGEGTVILKQLVLSLPKPQIQQEIEPEQISKTIPLLPTTGYVEQVKISQENQLSIKGWVAAVNSGFLENMKVILGGVEIQNFQLKKGFLVRM